MKTIRQIRIQILYVQIDFLIGRIARLLGKPVSWQSGNIARDTTER
jgi:hypothetical protein